ncbi:MAG: hypothetical protein ABIQ16_27040 [Polyangiaceae bacterium]
MPSATLPSHRTWLVHLFTLTAFVLCLSWAGSASAAVPMCGARGQSIAAPPIGTPTSDAALSAGSPCNEASPLRALGAPPREAPQHLSFYEIPIRALPVFPSIAPCPVAVRLSPAAADDDLLATGFAQSIDRPPRA